MEIYIDGNYSNIRFSAAHFIPGDWKCSRIHGHDYSISVRIKGDMRDESYFMDFSKAKAKLREIADYLDHMVLIPQLHPGIIISTYENNKNITMDGKTYSFPSEECRIIPVKDTTAECLSDYLIQSFISSVDDRVSEVELEVHEGPGQYAKSTWKRN
ncbi:MAG: 6-pyruvoyl tetrahydropterin synthase family protein [Thermoplasmatales archaeon]